MNKEEFNLRVGEFIRIHREKIKFSARQLGQKSGVNYMIICRLEGSIPFKNLNPRIHSLKNILEALDKDFRDLFDYVYGKEKLKKLKK